MTRIAEILGRVMMTAVKLPRSTSKDKYLSMKTFAEIEYRKGDQAYVLDCLINDRRVDIT